MNSIKIPFKEYFTIKDSYGCFSAYHVAFADSLTYRQLVLYIRNYSQWIDENFENIIRLEILRAVSVTKSSQLKITWCILR